MENQENKDSIEVKNTINIDNTKSNLLLKNNPDIKKNILNLRNKLYNYKKNKNIYNLSSNKKNETTEKETEAEDNLEEKNINSSRKFGLSKRKHEKFMKVKSGDPLNPYMINWPSSFLKIGYNVGFHYNQLQKGVPLLRIQKLKKDVVFPPLYTIQYNKYTQDKNQIDVETEKLCCNSVVKKLFNPIKNKFGFSELNKNKQNNKYQTHYNKAFLQRDNEMKISNLGNKLNSENDLYEIKDNNIP